MLNRKALFENDSAITLCLSANFKDITKAGKLEIRRPAFVRMILLGGNEVIGNIQIIPRGKSRLEICNPPPLWMHFKTPGAGNLYGIGKLKLVWACKTGDYYHQLLLKEMLCYKVYNVLTNYSYKVKPLRIFYSDSSNNPEKFRESTGFFLEDIDDLAKRLGSREFEDQPTPSAAINSYNYTLMSMFQYMIGNTDWGISVFHNIKLIVPKDSSYAPPYTIPFDFDQSGMVAAEYACVDERLEISSAMERVYIGLPRSYTHIDWAASVFLDKKDEILETIRDCEGLSTKNKKETERYILSFFEVLSNKELTYDIFTKPFVLGRNNY
jgi:hypothetical protein